MTERLKRKIRVGMYGGGPGGFIGAVHRTAMAMDPRAELVAGAFSSSMEKTKLMGEELFLSSDRLYPSHEKMAEAEAAREDGIDVAVVVTPNALHYPAVKAFLEAGIHVVCEKPFVQTVEQAEELTALAEAKGLLCALTHNYTGYPLVKEAKHMVESGELGEVRMVMAEYPQDGLSKLGEGGAASGGRDVPWRLRREIAGDTFCLGDIGSHVENLVSYVTGLPVRRLQARMATFTGNELDDDVRVAVEYEGGAEGIYWASKIAAGYENSLKLRIFGTKASLEWEQEHPNYLVLKRAGKRPAEYLARGQEGLSEASLGATRLPQGHPEGYIESFANLYSDIFDYLSANLLAVGRRSYDFPDMYDGLRGLRFIRTCIESSQKDSQWVEWS